jgi:HK97 family phage portal protein
MLRTLIERRESWKISQEPPGWVIRGYGNQTVTGKNVDTESALGVPAVLAAISMLAEDTASLPLITYERLKPRGKRRADDFYLYSLLHDAPNPEHTSMVYREFIMGHLLGWGNHYSQKIYDNAGNLSQLWPLRPDRMRVYRENGKRFYEYTLQSGQRRLFTSDEIMHIPGFGFDGLVGYSKITLDRNAIALALSTEEFGGKFFENDARPGVVLLHPKAMKDVAYERLKESWNDQYSGSGNSHKMAILEEGLDIKEIGVPPQDAQYIELRKFQIEEICRIFRIPPPMLQDLERATFSNIEQLSINYVTYSLRPSLVRIEQGMSKDLMTTIQRQKYFVEHLVDSLLRGDTAVRYSAYNTGRMGGWLSVNDIREYENQNPIDGGDDYLTPLNMAIVGQPINENPPAGTSSSRSFLPVLTDAAARILRRETHDVLESAKKFMKRSDTVGFGVWLAHFYAFDHADFVAKQLAPIARGMAENAEKSLSDAVLEQVVSRYARNYAASSALLVQDLASQGLEALENGLKEWEKSERAAEIAEEALLGMGTRIESLREQEEPPVTVNITNNTPAQSAPTIEFKADIPTPVVNVSVPTQTPPNIMVNIPTQSVEFKADLPQPIVTVNVPQQLPPIVNVTNEVNIPQPPARQVTLTKDGDTWTGESK